MTHVAFPGLADYIAGLREFERDIKRATAEANREAAEHVQPLVQSAYREQYPNSRRAVAGIGKRATQRKAAITLNLRRFPYLMGREFGARRFKQFPPHRGRRGYFLYPTLRERTDEIVEFYAEAHVRALKRAFPR